MKARKLIFEPSEPKDWRALPRRRYHLLWDATHNPNWRGREDGSLRSLMALMTAVESVADRVEGETGDTFVLKAEGGEMLLSVGEFDLLKESWEAYKGLMPNSLARERFDFQEWLMGAPTVDVVDK